MPCHLDKFFFRFSYSIISSISPTSAQPSSPGLDEFIGCATPHLPASQSHQAISSCPLVPLFFLRNVGPCTSALTHSLNHWHESFITPFLLLLRTSSISISPSSFFLNVRKSGHAFGRSQFHQTMCGTTSLGCSGPV
jgi:hypothetical protein